MKHLPIAILPLAILLLLSVVACLLGYGLALLFPAVPLNQWISKTTLVLLLLGLFPTMRWLNLAWQDIGFARLPVFFSQLLKGFALGLVSLLPVIAVLYGLEVQVPDEKKVWTPESLVGKMAIAWLLAMLVSLLEEPLFRGVLLSGLAKKLPLYAAIFLSAAYYAGLHFLTNKTKVPAEELSLSAAFELLAGAYLNWFNPEIVSAFLSLLMVGIFLGLLRTRLKTSLAWCIGCHAAWVWQIKVTKDLFNVNLQSPFIYLVSNYDGVIGPLVTVWLALGLSAYWFFGKRLAGH